MMLHPTCRQFLAPLLVLSLSATDGRAGPDDTLEAIDADLFGVLEQIGPAHLIRRELSVDTDGTRRLIVPGTCEEAGELQLRRMTRTGKLEEAFVLLPDRCIWIDVGARQTATSVQVERRVVDALVEAFGSVVLYHTHLQGEDEVAAYFPAYSDLLAVVLINTRHLRDQRIEIIHRVVTPLAILEYSFTPSEAGRRLIGVIFETGLARFAGENLLLAYSGSDRQGAYHAVVRDCLALLKGSQEIDACFPMQAGDFTLIRRGTSDGLLSLDR